MCTASWLIQDDGFELFFNRDESVRRGRARPPQALRLAGVRAVAPLDPDAGGTWLGANEFGLALGLLNARDARAEVPGPRSRGLLVRDLLSAPDAASALERLDRTRLEQYRAFTLVLFEPGREPRVRDWDGRELDRPAARLPLCSSSLERGRAQAERERVLARLAGERGELDRAVLERFQRSHEPERGPWSPCMHRADASTVSATQVRVDACTIALRYAGGPPCTAEFGPWIEIERARGPARD